MTAIGEDWVIVFVTTFLLSPKTFPVSEFTMAGARGSPPDLPAELWMYIHRLALSDISPLAKLHAQDETIRYNGPEHPMSDKNLKPFFKAARSLQRVCRLWAKLAQDLLYENIRVNETRRWPSLSNALLQPEIAILVRNVRLSPTRFDHNEFMLRHCGPHINVLVQPEFPRSERLYTATLHTPLPPLLSLTRVYWIESAWSAPLLRAVLAAAPNIQHLSLSSSPSIGTGLSAATLPVFPPLPRLQSLVLLPLTPSCVYAILHATNLAQLTHLTIAPVHLEWPAFPVLPALRALTLFDDRAPAPLPFPPAPPPRVPFPAILALLPALAALHYSPARLSATDAPPPPDARAPALTCVHLYLGAEWLAGEALGRLRAHAAALCGAAFGALERVVLDGPGWVAGAGPCAGWEEWAEWRDLNGRGCGVVVGER
ncbi:hypothetical protein DFH08DRAFT_1088882 [Mycena albidolilacea]|uniref:F-box domain-containing protein n=1 Tax=Mycena albidolilacea TaxID=1033008 RepID=A0AAD6Z4E3_9AGAR|nr:hypothetical protein DFH08DRAFT_1088882 [Mycena albidolilacea]